MRFKKVILWILTAVFLVMLFIPGVYWFNNPELTRMELFLKLWDVYLLMLGLAIGIGVLFKKAYP